MNVGPSRAQAASNTDQVLAAILQSVTYLTTTNGALSDQLKAQSVTFAAKSGALSDRVEVVIDRLNRLERERENRDANPTPRGSPTFRQFPPLIDRGQCTEHSKSNGIESRTFQIPTYLEID